MAQIDTGGLTGTVLDPTGAAVPAAKITLTNVGTNVSATTTSTSTGTYSFGGVLPGTYNIQAEAGGFQNYVVQGLDVHLQQVLTVDVHLTKGSVQQNVTVTAASPLLQAENAALWGRPGLRPAGQQPAAWPRGTGARWPNSPQESRRRLRGSPLRTREVLKALTSPSTAATCGKTTSASMASTTTSRYTAATTPGPNAAIVPLHRRGRGIQGSERRLQCRVRSFHRRSRQRGRQIGHQSYSRRCLGVCAQRCLQRQLLLQYNERQT